MVLHILVLKSVGVIITGGAIFVGNTVWDQLKLRSEDQLLRHENGPTGRLIWHGKAWNSLLNKKWNGYFCNVAHSRYEAILKSHKKFMVYSWFASLTPQL